MNSNQFWDKFQHEIFNCFYNEIKDDLSVEILNKKHLEHPIFINNEVRWTPSVEIEKLWKELSDLDDTLEMTKKDYEDVLNNLEIRWEIAESRNRFLQKSIPTLQHYHKDCGAARSRYKGRELKAKDETNVVSLQVSRLQKELACLEKVKGTVTSRLDNFLFFNKYIENVLDESNRTFKNRKHILYSFQNLLNIKRNLHCKTTNHISQHFVKANELSSLKNTKQEEIMASSLYLDQLKICSSLMEQTNLRIEDVLYMTKNHTRKQFGSVQQLQDSIRNLYILLCNQMDQDVTLKEDDFPNQFRFIEKYLKEVDKLKSKGKIALETTSEAVVIPKSYYEENQKQSIRSKKLKEKNPK